jgi:hypothetical protein
MTRVRAARTAAVSRGSAVLVVLAGALLPGVVVLAAPASACTAAAQPTAPLGSPERDAVDAQTADAVVVGTPVAFYGPPYEPDSLSAPAVYTLEVDAVLKGTATRLERVVVYTSLITGCGGAGGSGLVLHQRMVVFLRSESPPTLGARYTLGSGSHAVASADDVDFPGAVAGSPLPGGSIATANNTPGVGPSTQSQVLTAALVGLGIAVGAVVSARLLRRHRNRWPASPE